MDGKQKTVGVSPKVPVQAVVTVIAFCLTYFGVELSPEAAGGISAVLGIVGGVLASPGTVKAA
jgi:hypothetical protein